MTNQNITLSLPEEDLREARLQQGLDLGTGGRVTWSRDDLHER
jgi:hypothetical protein